MGLAWSTEMDLSVSPWAPYLGDMGTVFPHYLFVEGILNLTTRHLHSSRVHKQSKAAEKFNLFALWNTLSALKKDASLHPLGRCVILEACNPGTRLPLTVAPLKTDVESSKIPNNLFATLLRRRLGYPLPPEFSQSVGKVCGSRNCRDHAHIIDPNGEHAVNSHLVVQRHNLVRDALTAGVKEDLFILDVISEPHLCSMHVQD